MIFNVTANKWNQPSFVLFQDVVQGMKFGRFGREDGVLVMTTKGLHVIICYTEKKTILPFDIF